MTVTAAALAPHSPRVTSRVNEPREGTPDSGCGGRVG